MVVITFYSITMIIALDAKIHVISQRMRMRRNTGTALRVTFHAGKGFKR